MQDEPAILQQQTEALAAIARLDLSPDRLNTLSWSLDILLVQLAQLRALDAGDREPPVITCDGFDSFEGEAPA